jgi:hypothetical protein
MDLSAKEQTITLAALTKYMEHLEGQLESDDLDEDERADIANDATLLEILIARFEAEISGQSAPRS